MTRHRSTLRVVALAMAVAVVVAVGASVWWWWRQDEGSPVREVLGVPQDRPGPVLLVPGYGGSTPALEGLAARLHQTGRPVAVVPLPGNGTGDLRAQARALDAAARAALRGGAPSVDVVGYSAGGVVARVWAQDLGGDRVARRVVTIGSPHHGTELAGLGLLLGPRACPRACRQLATGSDLLTGLQRVAPTGPVWTSVWTARDEVVRPPRSAVLAGAVGVRLEAVCGGDVAPHGRLPADPLVAGIVLRALDGPPLRSAPAAGDCRELRAAGGA